MVIVLVVRHARALSLDGLDGCGPRELFLLLPEAVHALLRPQTRVRSQYV